MQTSDESAPSMMKSTDRNDGDPLQIAPGQLMTHSSSTNLPRHLLEECLSAEQLEKVAETPFCASPATLPIGIDFIMDTGCGYDLIRRGIASYFKEFVRRSARAVTLLTANSVTKTAHTLVSWIPQLGQVSRALIMDDTPSVLSVGRRTMKHGYGFYWPPATDAFLILPDGSQVTLETSGYLPYLTKDTWPVPTDHQIVIDYFSQVKEKRKQGLRPKLEWVRVKPPPVASGILWPKAPASSGNATGAL